MAVRLARFNVEHDDSNLPKWTKNFFKGVPAPAGATLLMFPIYSKFAGLELKLLSMPEFYMGWLVFTASLLISNIRTFSLKGIKIPSRKRKAAPIMYVLVAGALLCYIALSVYSKEFRLDKTGWQAATFGTVVYFCSFPLSHSVYLNLCWSDKRKSM